MGLRPDQVFTKQGLQTLEDLLELHGPMFFGLTYDPNEKNITANDVVEATYKDKGGLTKANCDEYNRNYAEMWRQGRMGIHKK
jgi:hypothetical protein